jgi:pSer/pThr/pTyr-binding forkhead associated (FHA) protein
MRASCFAVTTRSTPRQRLSTCSGFWSISENQATLEDLGSKNGTFLGGKRIAEPARLQHGDKIRVGPFVLAFCVNGPGATTETEVDTTRS